VCLRQSNVIDREKARKIRKRGTVPPLHCVTKNLAVDLAGSHYRAGFIDSTSQVRRDVDGEEMANLRNPVPF
jgi:hypothetical protein